MIVAIILLSGGYATLNGLGYYISPKLKLERNGFLKILIENPSAKIFIDGKKVATASGGSVTFRHLSETTHSIIVSKDGYWPWTKTVKIAAGQTVTYHPFLIEQTEGGEIVTGADPEYEKLLSLIREAKPPSKFDALFSTDKKIKVWTEDNRVYAEWQGQPIEILEFFCAPECMSRITVAALGAPVSNVAFLKNRDDVLVFGDGLGLYAIELDKRGLQNFMPIYRGQSVKFFQAADGSFYLTDNGNLIHIDPR